MSKKNLITYWVSSILIALPLTFGGIGLLRKTSNGVEEMIALGYPIYLMTILGVAKLLAVIVVLAPKLPRLKEWAYAGISINLIGASISHAVADEPFSFGHVAMPLVFLLIALVSWCFRPADRKL